MAALAASDIRDYVRLHLDVEVDELPDSLLNSWLYVAYNKLVGAVGDSQTWLHVEYSFDTVAAQQAYPLDTTSGLLLPTVLQSIEDVRGPQWSISPQSHQSMRARYSASVPGSARPVDYSMWARSIYLWPIPTSVETIYVTGTRQPIDWVAINDAPDCPEEYHFLIQDYALGRGYAQQDDPENATQYLNGWDQAVKQLAVRWEDGQRAQPLVVNGGGSRSAYRLERYGIPAIFPFE